MNQFQKGSYYPSHRNYGQMPMMTAPAYNTAPLAMAFVNQQCWGQTYEPSVGLKQGTIFPELDLPFCCGRCRK